MKFTRRDSVTLLVTSLLFGLVTDTLVRQSIFGLNFLLWSVMWSSVLLAAAFLKGRLTPRFVLISVIAILNSIIVYLRAEPVVQAWSILIAITSILLMGGILYTENFMDLTLVNRSIEYVTGVIKTVANNAKSIMKPLNIHPSSSRQLHMSPGPIIAVVLGIIFIGLFSGSDAVFKHQFSFIGSFFETIADWFGRYTGGRFVSVLFWVGVSSAALLILAGRDTPVKPIKVSVKKFLSRNDPAIILGTLCVVFGIFILIQIKYLFAGGQLPDNLTYANYARRGYGELLVATMLASAVIYASIAYTKDHVLSRANAILPNMLVILNSIVVLSAWKRLSLYESAYGWTMTRFIARLGLICILLGSILLLLWVNRHISTKRLFGGAWYAIAAVLTVAALLNPMSIIVQKNITERAKREVPLDAYYLSTLSADSHTALCAYAPSLKKSHPKEYKSLVAYIKQHGSFYARTISHGLAAHYTSSKHYQKSFDDCLK